MLTTPDGQAASGHETQIGYSTSIAKLRFFLGCIIFFRKNGPSYFRQEQISLIDPRLADGLFRSAAKKSK